MYRINIRTSYTIILQPIVITVINSSIYLHRGNCTRYRRRLYCNFVGLYLFKERQNFHRMQSKKISKTIKTLDFALHCFPSNRSLRPLSFYPFAFLSLSTRWQDKLARRSKVSRYFHRYLKLVELAGESLITISPFPSGSFFIAITPIRPRFHQLVTMLFLIPC